MHRECILVWTNSSYLLAGFESLRQELARKSIHLRRVIMKYEAISIKAPLLEDLCLHLYEMHSPPNPSILRAGLQLP